MGLYTLKLTILHRPSATTRSDIKPIEAMKTRVAVD